MPQHTPDLFGETPCELAVGVAGGALARVRAGVSAGVNTRATVVSARTGAASSPSGTGTAPKLGPRAAVAAPVAAAGNPIDHLAAAQALHRRLRRATAYSPEQIKAGRLICRHLVALINSPAATAQH